MFSRRVILASASALVVRPTMAASSRAPYFSDLQREAIISDPSRIKALWASDGDRFRSALGQGFGAETTEHVQFGFCGMVAHDLKPYVQCTTVDLRAMLDAPGLDCDNYVALTWDLFNLLVPEQTITVASVGWDGGSIGNHSQLFISKKADVNGNGGGYWLVDPTVGVFQCGYDFDGICSGKPAAAKYRGDLYQRPGTVTDWLHGAVINSLADGLYRPSNLFYYFEDLSAFLFPLPIETWPTPRGAAFRKAQSTVTAAN